MKVLVVEDDIASRNYLEVILRKEGHDFRSADNGVDGLEIFKEYSPEIVLSDINMAQMNGLELLEHIKRIKPDAIIIMLTAFNSEEYVVEAMKLGANNYLKKPVLKNNLITLLRKYDSVIASRKSEKKIQGFIKKHNFNITFKSNIEIIPSIVNYLVTEIEGVFAEEVLLDIKLGLGELILNAVEHGNLEISFIEKSNAVQNDQLQQLYYVRLSDPDLRRRTVQIDFAMNEEQCEWTITDEGDGFDPESIPNPISDDGILRLHGRGIFICKFQFDSLLYQDIGNKVTAVKIIKTEQQ